MVNNIINSTISSSTHPSTTKSSNPSLSETIKQSQKMNDTASSSTGRHTVTSSKHRHGCHVFVRVRPFLSQIMLNKSDDDSDEVQIDSQTDLKLNDLVTTTTLAQAKDESIAALTGSIPINGFNGVFGIDASNKYVFQHSFLPRIETIMKGGTASVFCYGYTGAGKTHTTLGYDGEYGIFHLAAEEILKRVSILNEQQKDSGSYKEPYFIIASAIEVYNDEVYDLQVLGEKAKCSLRKNKRGQLLVRGATQKIVFTEEDAEKNGIDYSVVTKTLSAIHIHSVSDLNMIQHRAEQHRKVGISSTHSQSSRSHAVFRLDIVNQTLLDAMEELEKAEQIKPAIQTAYDKKRTYQLRHRVLDIEKKINETSQFIDEIYLRDADKKSPFGGRLILVDLAGADSDQRSIAENGQTIAQRKESTAINMSLMALKDCINGLASSNTMKSIPFRNSSLTRLLEEVLTPREKRDSDSVMIVNIGPEDDLKSKTVNSLRYGSMFSTLKGGKKELSTNRGVRSRGSSRTRESLTAAKLRMKTKMQVKSDE